MDNDALLSHIANRISNCSKHYTAEVTEIPRAYHGNVDGKHLVSASNGLRLKRYEDSYWLPTKGFVFAPDIVRYATRTARTDKDFAQRLSAMDLNADDIEVMIHRLTYGKIKLFMRGRKVFFDDDGSVNSL